MDKWIYHLRTVIQDCYADSWSVSSSSRAVLCTACRSCNRLVSCARLLGHTSRWYLRLSTSGAPASVGCSASTTQQRRCFSVSHTAAGCQLCASCSSCGGGDLRHIFLPLVSRMPWTGESRFSGKFHRVRCRSMLSYITYDNMSLNVHISAVSHTLLSSVNGENGFWSADFVHNHEGSLHWSPDSAV